MGKTKRKITTRMSIDFFLEKVRIYLDIENQIRIKQSVSNQLSIQNQEDKEIYITQVTGCENKKIIDKKFEISEDYKTVKIDNISYKIPSFYNKELVSKKDKNVWEMIFYQIFNPEICNEIKKIQGEEL